jgi:hypothetical protein
VKPNSARACREQLFALLVLIRVDRDDQLLEQPQRGQRRRPVLGHRRFLAREAFAMTFAGAGARSSP